MNLKWLIDPVHPTLFIEDYLERKPLVIKRNNPGYFDSLLRLQDVDVILERGLVSGRIEVIMQNAKKKIHAVEYLQSQNTRNTIVRTGFYQEKIVRLFQEEKATLLINSSVHEWEPIRTLIDNINTDLKTTSGANIFLTPPHAQCFEAHFDEHDLFIIQIAGKKRWKIYENAVYLPHRPQNGNSFDFSNLKLLYEVDVEAGDVVYFPRGFVHEVVTTDSLSAHITLGCMNITWATIISDFVRALVEQDPLLRSAFMKDLRTGQDNHYAIKEILKNKFEKDFSLSNLELVAQAHKAKTARKFEFNFQAENLAKKETI